MHPLAYPLQLQHAWSSGLCGFLNPKLKHMLNPKQSSKSSFLTSPRIVPRMVWREKYFVRGVLFLLN